jgi:hypothetical protein
MTEVGSGFSKLDMLLASTRASSTKLCSIYSFLSLPFYLLVLFIAEFNDPCFVYH